MAAEGVGRERHGKIKDNIKELRGVRISESLRESKDRKGLCEVIIRSVRRPYDHQRSWNCYRYNAK